MENFYWFDLLICLCLQFSLLLSTPYTFSLFKERYPCIWNSCLILLRIHSFRFTLFLTLELLTSDQSWFVLIEACDLKLSHFSDLQANFVSGRNYMLKSSLLKKVLPNFSFILFRFFLEEFFVFYFCCVSHCYKCCDERLT